MSRLDWSKERRLLRRPEFLACFEQGNKYFTKYFILFFLLREDRSGSIRLGLTVSRKVGPAVARNRIKRVVREYFRLHRHLIDFPYDIVVVPKRNLIASQLDLARTARDISPMLERIAAKHLESSQERN